jgi:hypothetical protein
MIIADALDVIAWLTALFTKSEEPGSTCTSKFTTIIGPDGLVAACILLNGIRELEKVSSRIRVSILLPYRN